VAKCSDVTSHGETLNSRLLAVGVPLSWHGQRESRGRASKLDVAASRHALPIHGQGVPHRLGNRPANQARLVPGRCGATEMRYSASPCPASTDFTPVPWTANSGKQAKPLVVGHGEAEYRISVARC
jgi:hypothetical protein